jgi:oligopeptide transport system ATP-binding protein
VRDVSFSLDRGRTVGIVGESGSGKSVTCSAIMGLLPKSASVESGSIVFDGTEVARAPEEVFRALRGKRIGMVFQDPMSALNPYLSVASQMTEALRLHKHMNRKEALEASVRELEAVGIPDAKERIDYYPHQFSGGQRQRILIASSLLLRPELLIADEPTTALDVTVQAQILELLQARQKELGTAVILITHNLGVAATLCDDIVVMYAGNIMERGSVADVLNHPAHPYTCALKKAIPSGNAGIDLFSIPGSPPKVGDNIQGCPFAPRCSYACEKCKCTQKMQNIKAAHFSSCERFVAGEIAP